MKCVISGGNIKILAKAIHMLAKIGDEMYVHPQDDCISFRSVSPSNSAYSDITFKGNYFSYYAFEDLDEDEALKCKILIRSALAVFKTPALLDKQVDACHIKLESNSNTISFILKYKNNITKTHLLPILDCETIKATYKKDGTANHLCIQPRVMSDVLQNLSQTSLEITLEVLQEKVLIRNYIDDNSNISNETRTQLVFGVGEFDEYTVISDTCITFCLKELRAILSFAEIISQPINIYFDSPGRPVVFVMKSASFETNLVLATLNPDVDNASQSTMSVQPVPRKLPSRRNHPKSKLGGVNSLTKRLLEETGKRTTTTASSSSHASNGATPETRRISDGNNQEENFGGSLLETQSSIGRISDVDTPDLRTRTGNSNATTGKVTNHAQSIRNSVFSSITNKQHSDYDQETSNGVDAEMNDDDESVQNSPPLNPSKKAKTIFKRCFQTTFDPSNLPGFMDVEVEDSGDETE